MRGRLSQVISTRKRMVGGFNAYDNRTDVRDLGALCGGSSDERGLLLCEAELNSAGQVELIASAKDATGHPVQAASSVWVTQQGELWFAQDNDDRIDVLPEKKRYERGDDPTVELKINKAWRPNVYVSVLALRGRIREVPWYSFFTWG